MLYKNKLHSLVFGVIVLIIFYPPLSSFAGTGPWQTRANETKAEGILIRVDSNHVRIRSTVQEYNYEYNQECSYMLTSNTLSALMGTNSGQLISPAEYPLQTEVELYVTVEGIVRAMRNKQIRAPQAAGKLLEGWGHNAILSPDEQCYVLYNWETGLHLYNISNPSPRFLTMSPVADWNAKMELAYVGESNNEIIIDNLVNNKQDSIVLDPVQPGLSRVITKICWNTTADKLYYTALEDYPNTGSEVFRLSVLDRSGRELGSTIIPDLSDSLWLSNTQILYVDNDNIAQNTSRLKVWNYLTGKSSLFLPDKNVCYRSVAYHPEQERLSFTTINNLQENIYYLDVASGIVKNLTTLVYPGRHLQWSKQGSLFYWDELNNHIIEIKENSSTITRFSGYLPPKGVQSGFLYFPAEPLEEPQQLFMAK